MLILLLKDIDATNFLLATGKKKKKGLEKNE